MSMAIAPSKVTSTGQIAVPVEVRRSGRFTSEDIHRAVFGERKPEARTLGELREGIRRYARKRQAL
jgi:hypothetical protein